MTGFQVLAIAVLAGLVSVTAGLGWRRLIPRNIAAVLLLLWGIGAAAVLAPESVSAVARRLGIGRGADLVLYLFILATVAGFMVIYTRLRRLRRDITRLVRELALRDAGIDRVAPGEREPRA